MAARLRSLVLVAVALVVPTPLLAGDLEPTPTTKQPLPPEPTAKDLSTTTGGTSLTPTPPPTGPKTAPKPTAEPSGPPSASASVPPIEEPVSPPSSASAAPPSATTFARRDVALGVGDLSASISLPEAWGELAESALPEVEPHEGVTVVVRKGFGVHEPKGKPPVVREVIVVCGKASGDYWADAVRDAAFTQMTAAVEKEAQRYTTLKTIEPEPIRVEGDKIFQSFAADAEFAIDGKVPPTPLGKGKVKPPTTVKLQGLSFIAFHAEAKGKTPDVVACSIACAQLVAEGEASACAQIVGSVEISGTFAPPPKRSWLAELVMKLKKDPTTFLLIVIGGAVLLAVAIVLVVAVFRKKKKAAAAGPADHDDHDDGFDAGYQAGIAAANAASEIRGTMHASPPPAEGFFDPQTLVRRKV